MTDKHNILTEEVYSDLYNLNNALSLSELLILHLNVRGLTSNYNNLELFVEHLVIKPDIIVCTETWALDCLFFFELNDYDIFYNGSKCNKADGVVLYIKKSLIYSVSVEVSNNISIISSTIKLKNNQSVKISGVYRCHDISKENFVRSISKFSDEKKHGNNHLLVGDFNINLMNSDDITNEFLSILLEREFLPYFNGVTRPNDSGGTCIDNIFVKTHIETITSFTCTNVFTDHYPIFVLLVWKPIKIESKVVYSINYNKLARLSSKNNWSGLTEIKDPNEFFKILIDKVQKLINESKVKVVNKENKNNNKPRSS